MNITPSEAARFAQLVKEEYGIDLTLEEAQQEGEGFLQLMYMLFRQSIRSPP